MRMDKISPWAVAALLILGVAAGCAPSEDAEPIEDEPMEEGSILYDPQRDPHLRPVINTPVYKDPTIIVDDKTGYKLVKAEAGVKLPGIEGFLKIWRLDRDKENKRPVYILTTAYRKKGFGPRKVVEIVL